MSNKDILVFQGFKIRRTKIQGEVFVSIKDSIAFLVETPRPEVYWSKLKNTIRKSKQSSLLNDVKKVKLRAGDGKFRSTEIVNQGTLFRIMMFVDSTKTRDFKDFISNLASDRVDLL